MATDCPHGFPKPANCTDCMADGNLPPLPPRPKCPQPTGYVTPARYPGDCRACHLPIHEGEDIAQMDNGLWEHAHHHEETNDG